MIVEVKEKCDRSGRIRKVEIDSQEISSLEEQRLRREESAQKIEEFISSIPPDDLPSLFAIYQGEIQYFTNVVPEFNDKCISRLLGELFRKSDPTKRGKRTRKKKNGSKKAEVISENSVSELTETVEV